MPAMMFVAGPGLATPRRSRAPGGTVLGVVLRDEDERDDVTTPIMPQRKNFHHASGRLGLTSSHFVATKNPTIASTEVT